MLGALIAPSRNCKSVLRLPPAFAEDLVTPTEGFFWGMALHSPRLVGFLRAEQQPLRLCGGGGRARPPQAPPMLSSVPGGFQHVQ